MTRYVGWTPTAIGRLSFSRIGDWRQRGMSICNVAEAPEAGTVFGAFRRRRAQILPGWMTRLWGRYPSTYVGFFLDVGPGVLPYHADKGSTSGDGCGVRLHEAADGALIGRVYYVRRWGWLRGRAAVQALEHVKDVTVRTHALDLEAARVSSAAAERRVAAAWRLMHRQLGGPRSVPDFGSARVTLLRTGECRVEVEVENQSLWRWVELVGVTYGMSEEDRADLAGLIRRDAAAEVFDALRDVAHKHYHHDGKDGAAALTEWTPGTDALWRERTLQALMRLCVANRRRDTADGYRRALGILAYADAFHRHLGKWRVKGERALPISPRVDYDFTALKASIDASLKGRELKDGLTRTRLIFAFGLLVTALTILIPTYRGWIEATGAAARPAPEHLSLGQTAITAIMRWAIGHPFWTLGGAVIFALFFDQVVHLISVGRPLKRWRSWSTGVSDALLAWMRGLKVGSRDVRAIVLFLLALSLLGVGSVWLRVAGEIQGSNEFNRLLTSIKPW